MSVKIIKPYVLIIILYQLFLTCSPGLIRVTYYPYSFHAGFDLGNGALAITGPKNTSQRFAMAAIATNSFIQLRSRPTGGMN